jgi:hypothetical protein
MKSQRITAAVATLCEAFNRKPTPATFAAYEIGLKGLTEEQVEHATAMALGKCKFMPVPAELRELAGTGGESYDSMAERAFHVLDGAVSQLGGDRSVNFHDGAINAAVRLLGGWQKCCDQPREEFEKWYRKDFLKTYVSICRGGASEELRRYHGGRIEQQNQQWVGRTLPSGITYQPGMFGSGIEAVTVDYVPALPAPAPTKHLSAAPQDIKVELKLIGRE